MERDVEFELTPSSTSPSEQVVHALRGGSDNGRGLSRESKSALPCLMLEVRRIRWWKRYRQTNERSLTEPSVLYPRCCSTRFHSFPYWYFTVGCKAVCIFDQKSFQRLGKFLQKSSYEDSCVWLSVCAHVCMCVSLWSLLIASERLTALIEAHRTPSTPHLHGRAAETQAVTIVVILSLRKHSWWWISGQ